MAEKEWFPLGLAEGRAFCDRDEERKQLKMNFRSLTHTLIYSPRRYGKTSLALQSTKEAGYILGMADFMIATDELSVVEIISRTLSQVISKLLPVHKSTLNKLSTYLKSLVAKIVISEQHGARIELTPVEKFSIANISDLLLGLDQLAQKENKQVVLLFDEFQQVTSLKGSATIEAAIRHAAQQTKASAYIFSGSNRHLLLKLFDDSTRPLFHLCHRIPLNRIPASDYAKYINEAAQARWGEALGEEVLDKILFLTQRHPYFLNSLCKIIWYEDDLPKSVTDIQTHFIGLCEMERPRVSHDLSVLSANQRAVLMALSKEKTKMVKSRAFIVASRVSLSSIAQAINVLEEKDYIYRDEEDIYCITDPVMQHILAGKN